MLRLIRPAAVSLAVTGLLVTATAGLAARPAPVVPPGGKVAGETYAQWLATEWKTLFSHPPGYVGCHTVRGITATFGGVSGKKTESYRCTVHGGAVYVNGYGVECSTVEKAPFHGTTPDSLKACAKRNYAQPRTVVVTLDGKRVSHARYVAASPVFTLHLPANNLLGSKKRTGQSAAYGEALLLRGLHGTHVVHVKVSTKAGYVANVTYRLTFPA